MNNDGDEVTLIDAGGVVRSRVAYTREQARAGVWLKSARPNGENREQHRSDWLVPLEQPTMNDGDAKRSSTERSKALVGVVTVLVVVLAVWGYLRGLGGKVGSAIQGVEQLAPQAERQNRHVARAGQRTEERRSRNRLEASSRFGCWVARRIAGR